jgi:hypothetical protein
MDISRCIERLEPPPNAAISAPQCRIISNAEWTLEAITKSYLTTRLADQFTRLSDCSIYETLFINVCIKVVLSKNIKILSGLGGIFSS